MVPNPLRMPFGNHLYFYFRVDVTAYAAFISYGLRRS